MITIHPASANISRSKDGQYRARLDGEMFPMMPRITEPNRARRHGLTREKRAWEINRLLPARKRELTARVPAVPCGVSGV
jgi:hypothetical protein